LVSYAYRYSFRATVAKGKLATKSKAITASSSRPEDENVELLNAEYKHHDSDAEQHIEENSEEVGDHDEDGGDVEPEREAPNQATSHDGVRDASSLDETAAIAFFNDYRQFGSYMMGLSSRLKTMLANIKATADPTTRLLTLQELSELLSISTEDTLAGSFQVEQFVRELVRILGGRGAPNEDDDDGDDDDRPEREEDAALAAALALSTGNTTYQGDENLEAQVLACRCLANLMEALPGVAHTVVYHGAIPVLCSKLIEISYIDLAEQTLSVSIILLSWRLA
jgi:E3 ubiquitin-protein ligase TRIP12